MNPSSTDPTSFSVMAGTVKIFPVEDACWAGQLQDGVLAIP